MLASLASMALDSLRESNPEIADSILSINVVKGIAKVTYKSGHHKDIWISSIAGRYTKINALAQHLIKIGPQ